MVEGSRGVSRLTFDSEELRNGSENQGVGRAGNSYEDDSDGLERRISQPVHGGQSATPSSSHREQFGEPLFPNPDEDLTLGQYILDRVGDAFKGLFRNSQTILRVDLRQALRYDVPLRRQLRMPVQSQKARPTSIRQPGRRSETEFAVDEGEVQSRPWSHGLQGGGARLKLMQVSQLVHISSSLMSFSSLAC